MPDRPDRNGRPDGNARPDPDARLLATRQAVQLWLLEHLDDDMEAGRTA